MSENIIPIVKPVEIQATPPITRGPAIAATQPVRFQLPTYDVTLPSQGYFYDTSSPLSSGVVKIRELTVRDEDTLNNSKLIKNGTVLDTLLKNVIVEPVNCLDQMLNGDKNAVFFAIRKVAYGDVYKTKISCPHCREENNISIDLSKLINAEFDFSKYKKGVNSVEYVLPSSGKHVVFKLMTHEDETKILHEIKELEKFSKTESPVISTRLKYIILSVDGNTQKSFIKNFIDNELSSKDSLQLRNVIKESMPDIDNRFNFTCEHCSHEERIDVPLTISFMWPNVS